MDIALELRRYLRMLRHWAWLIILGILLAGGVNFYLTTKAPLHYEASTTLMVGQIIRQVNPDQQEIGLIDRLAGYYLELLRRQPVLEGVKQELKLDLNNEQLSSMLTARVVPSTAFIELTVTDTEPQRGVRLVNAFASELIKQSPTAPENQRKEQRDFIQKQLDDLQSKIEEGRQNLAALNNSLNSSTTAAEIEDTKGKIKALETQIDAWQTNYTNLLRTSNVSAPNSISVLEESKQARLAKTINPLLSAGIAGAVGGGLALVCALLLEYLDDRIKSADDLRTRFRLTVLGHVPYKRPKNSKKRLGRGAASDEGTGSSINYEAAQAYEILCTNILFSDTFNKQRKSLLITASGQLTQQAAIARDLAIAMVSFEQTVLLIDANTRKPEIHELLGIENRAGFYEIFYGSGYSDLKDKVVETAIPNLYLMPAGLGEGEDHQIVVIHPGTQHIYSLPQTTLPGDFAIFNCGSILEDKTTRLLTSHITGTVLVCELYNTRGQELKAAIEIIERLKGQVLGIVTTDRAERFIFRLLKLRRRKKNSNHFGTEASAA